MAESPNESIESMKESHNLRIILVFDYIDISSALPTGESKLAFYFKHPKEGPGRG
jgi:hypothetical protein